MTRDEVICKLEEWLTHDEQNDCFVMEGRKINSYGDCSIVLYEKDLVLIMHHLSICIPYAKISRINTTEYEGTVLVTVSLSTGMKYIAQIVR